MKGRKGHMNWPLMIVLMTSDRNYYVHGIHDCIVCTVLSCLLLGICQIRCLPSYM